MVGFISACGWRLLLSSSSPSASLIDHDSPRLISTLLVCDSDIKDSLREKHFNKERTLELDVLLMDNASWYILPHFCDRFLTCKPLVSQSLGCSTWFPPAKFAGKAVARSVKTILQAPGNSLQHFSALLHSCFCSNLENVIPKPWKLLVSSFSKKKHGIIFSWLSIL